MIDENKLNALSGAVLGDGDLWAFMPDGRLVKIAGPGASDDFRNLRNASLIMYHTLGNVETWVEFLIAWLESVGGEVAVDKALKLQAAVRVSRRCATEGLEKIATDQKKG